MKMRFFHFVLVVSLLTVSACDKKESGYVASVTDVLVTSVYPSSGLKKDIIVITGRNFSTVKSENIVEFNGIKAVVLEAAPNRLEVIVPENATTGNVSITVSGQKIEGPRFSIIEQVSNYIVSTVAGATAFGFVDGNGLEARFRNPDGILIDLNGDVIITDRTNHSIRKMTPAGVVTTLAGTGVAGYADGKPGQFRFPWQSTMDKTGNIIVVEKDGARIRKIASDGTVSTLAGTGSLGFQDGAASVARFNQSLDAVSDSEGNIFVVDRDNRRIRKITPNGTVSTFAGNGTTAIFTLPIALTIDEQDNLFVSDASRIKMITKTGVISTIVGSTKGYDDGTPGEPLTVKLGDIFGLNFDNDGNILLADASNHRIRKLTPGAGNDWTKATVTTIAGTGTAGRTDGLGHAATFNQPYDVAVDAQGAIYVADNINNSIRKIVYK